MVVKTASRALSFKVLAIAPMVAMLLAFSFYPVIQLFLMSFADVTYLRGARVWEWVGFANYLAALRDEIFWVSLRNTFVYWIGAMSAELLIGFGLALAASRVTRFATVYRTILMLPLLVPPIAVATAWRLIFNANFGLVNQVALALGLPQQYWLSNPETALAAIIAVSVWYWTSYTFILLLAGLQSIPSELYEAARIDGARGWASLRFVTLPLLAPALIVTVLFRTINAFKVFDIVYALTGGGPGISTEVINTYAYKVFITQHRLGYGASLSALAILIVAVIAISYNRIFSVRGVR